jgi:hypothetical protein
MKVSTTRSRALICHLSPQFVSGTICRTSGEVGDKILRVDGVSYPLPVFPTGRSPNADMFYRYFTEPLKGGSFIEICDEHGPLESAVVGRNKASAEYLVSLVRQALLRTPHWVIDHVETSGSTARFRGWYISEAETAFSVLANGRKPDHVSYLDRADVESYFGAFRPRLWPTTFVGDIQLLPDERDIRFVLTGPVGTSAVPDHWFPLDPGNAPMPSVEQIERVNGPSSISTFICQGYSTYRLFSALFREYLNPHDCLDILEWGCGCGSAARFFLNDHAFRYFGSDIDTYNLTWCRRNLHLDRFFELPLLAPKERLGPLFDGIFAVSVISHLSPDNIGEWSEWLAMQLKPGGILIITTLGLQAVANEAPTTIHKVLSEGAIFAEDRGHKIGQVIGNQGYYGVGYQTPEYLRDTFSKWFELMEYRWAGKGHQDMYVFRRRD